MQTISALVALAFGGQQENVEVVRLTLQAAWPFEVREVEERLPAREMLAGGFREDLLKAVLELELENKLTLTDCSRLVKKLTLWYIFPTGSILSLPSRIASRYGNLSPKDLIDIFPIRQIFQQADGWSCGQRTVFSAAGIQLYFSQMTRGKDGSWQFPVDIDTCLQTFFDGTANVQHNPAITEAIEYLRFRRLIRLTYQFLYENIELIEPAIEFLQEDGPKIAEAIYKLQPNYFIVRCAEMFIRNEDLDHARLILLKDNTKNNPAIKKALEELNGGNGNAALESLAKFEKPYIILAIDELCRLDDEISCVLEYIEHVEDPKVKVAFALFLAEAECMDILSVLEQSEQEAMPGIIESVQRDRAKIVQGISSLNQFDKKGLEEAKDHFRQVKKPPAITRVQQDLGELKEVVDQKVKQIHRQAKKCERLLVKDALVKEFIDEKAEASVKPQSPEKSSLIVARIVESLQKKSYCKEIREVLACLGAYPFDLKQAVSLLNERRDIELFKHACLMLSIDHKRIPAEILRISVENPNAEVVIAVLERVQSGSAKPGQLLDVQHVSDLCQLEKYNLIGRNVHIVGKDPQEGVLKFNRFDAICSEIPEEEIIRAGDDDNIWNGLIESAIKNDIDKEFVHEALPTPRVHHFLSNLPAPGEHWILISLVRIPGRKPFLVMLDSLNSGIDERRANVLAFIYNKFIRKDNN